MSAVLYPSRQRTEPYPWICFGSRVRFRSGSRWLPCCLHALRLSIGFGGLPHHHGDGSLANGWSCMANGQFCLCKRAQVIRQRLQRWSSCGCVSRTLKRSRYRNVIFDCGATCDSVLMWRIATRDDRLVLQQLTSRVYDEENKASGSHKHRVQPGVRSQSSLYRDSVLSEDPIFNRCNDPGN